jgi:hypothetical protein
MFALVLVGPTSFMGNFHYQVEESSRGVLNTFRYGLFFKLIHKECWKALIGTFESIIANRGKILQQRGSIVPRFLQWNIRDGEGESNLVVNIITIGIIMSSYNVYVAPRLVLLWSCKGSK